MTKLGRNQNCVVGYYDLKKPKIASTIHILFKPLTKPFISMIRHLNTLMSQTERVQWENAFTPMATRNEANYRILQCTPSLTQFCGSMLLHLSAISHVRSQKTCRHHGKTGSMIPGTCHLTQMTSHPSSHACRDHEREQYVGVFAEPGLVTYHDITENNRFGLNYRTIRLPFNAIMVMEKVTRISRFLPSCLDLCRISKYHLLLARVATTHHARNTRCFY